MRKPYKFIKTGRVLFFILLSFTLILRTKGQIKASSYAALFDTLFDSYGNKFLASDLTLFSEKSITPGGVALSSIPTQTCQAGKFILHFDPGSIFTTSSASVVICQVLSDVSAFINSPTLTPANPIHIFCGNTNTVATPSLLGVASSFYLIPAAAPTNSNQGLILGQVEKGMLFGIDPYANFPFTSFVPQTNSPPNTSNLFYSGYINAKPDANWNYNLTTVNIGATEYDFYTVMLHEVTHTLGFGSLISGNGTSKFGIGYNYFSKYDTYLTNSSGNPLLASSTPSCPNSNISFTLNPNILGATTNCTPTATDITPTCAAAVRYNSLTNTNIAVFTPSCYAVASSLSHFEDMCSAASGFTSACTPTPSSPGYNDLYFAMCNAISTGSCFVKRYLKQEERNVLCDLGYSVNPTFSCSNTSAIISSGTYSHSYGSGCSPSLTILGVNDGLTGNVFTFTCTSTSTIIPFSTLLANDTPTGLSVECGEHISGPCSFTFGPNNLTVTATVGSGLKIFKYLPKNSNGQLGNITYVYVYFAPPGCIPAGGCNLVENGGFETNTSCGALNQPTLFATLSCWEDLAINNSYSELLSTSCTSTLFDLSVSTLSLSPPISSHNGTVNNTAVMALSCSFPGSGTGDALKTNLNAPLVPGQSYQISFWALNHGKTPTSAPGYNPNNDKIVISIASSSAAFVPANNFPTGSNVWGSFTLNAGNLWNQITHTFVLPVNTPPQTVFYIGVNVAATQSGITTGTLTNDIYCFIDDIQINAVPGPSFTLPSTITPCGVSNISYTNLAQYASGAAGAFSGSFVTTSTVNNQVLYHFNISQTSLSAGTYPIAYNYTLGGGCTGTLIQNILIDPNSYSLSVLSTPFCSNTAQSATCTPVNPTFTGTPFYNWYPGNTWGSSQTFTNSTIVYTVVAYLGSCVSTTTFALLSSTNCCTGTVSPYNSAILASPVSGPILINGDLNVPSGSTGILSGGKFHIAPNVKIIVNSGATLRIKDAHLFACQNEMWEGIKVLEGGKLEILNEFGVDNLIEDAICSISISPQTTSTPSSTLDISNTTFNKNYFSIIIGAYQKTLTTYPISIKNSVFTCRDLSSSITSTSWPQVTTNTFSTVDLRSTVNPTTGLTPPYLAQSSFTITNLKSPYTNQKSKYAIQLNDVGLTSGNTFYGIQVGDLSAASYFNLFDAHEIFIFSTNSNVKSYNNIFQNTRHASIILPGALVKTPSSAILANVTNNMNTNLDLTGSSFSVGNRFWNCHRAIQGFNTYRFNIEKGIFRSTQSTSPASGNDVGRVGIHLKTNRMQYFMRYNEFSNIGNCINVPIVASSFTSMATGSVQYGVYAANVAVLFNTISIGSGTNNFVNNAVNVSAVNAIPWTIAPDYTTSTLNKIGIKIENNNISDARRGIYVENVTGFVTEITENSVALVPDNLFSVSQHAVHLSYFTAGFNKWQHSVIGSNTLSAQTVTNTLSTLVFCGSNPGGPFSPSVSCNVLSDAYHGFNFTGWNLGTFWRGNKMDPMPKGLVISTGGINTQGSSGNPVENEWRNASLWTTNTYTQTYVENAFALNSVLWVESGATTNPTINSGSGGNSSNWYVPGSSIFTTTGSYSCGDEGDPTDFILSVPEADNFDTDELFFNAQYSLFRYLHFNDSLRVGGTAFGDFYDDMDGSVMGNLLQAEEELYEGNYGTARTILSGLTPTNSIEENFISFYSLYANYQEDVETEAYYSTTDSTLLFELANLCPEIHGHVVYQARALYYVIYGLSWQYSDCSETGSRLGIFIPNSKSEASHFALSIFPNPAQSEIYIFSNRTIQNASLMIHDLSSRSFYESTAISLEQGKSKININLINGAYILTIIDNKTKESHVFKLFIAN